MGKIRSLKSQLNHAISESYHQTSKKADRENPEIDTKERTYSINRIEGLRSVADTFSKFMKENYPEVRMAKDITRDHVQAFCTSREKQWSERTAEERISQFKKLGHLINAQFGGKNEIAKDIIISPKNPPQRTVSMDREDFEKLRSVASDSQSPAKDGLELGARFGLRSCEVVGLKGSEIDLEKGVIHIGDYAKGGRHRDIPIREKDRSYAEDLKERSGEGRCVPLQAESYNRQVRRWMERAEINGKYPNTTEHAIRKMYVKERMEELRGEEAKDPRTDKIEREAWEKVQVEIGHGEKMRIALYDTYAK